MRADRLSVLLPIGALLVPWLGGATIRHQHGLLLAGLSLALAAAAISRPPGIKAERALLPLLMVASWPASLVAAVQDAIGIGRFDLIVGASLLVLVVLSWRVMQVRRSLPVAQRSMTTLLERSFPQLVSLAGKELRLFWFGLFRWRRNASDAPADAVLFPGTATGVEPAMCLLTAAGFGIETPLLHLVLAHVGTQTVAWSCTGLHAILGIYLVGYAKSLWFRPTLLFADRLEIRLGVLARRVVPHAAIEAVETHDGQTRPRAGDQRLFGLDEPNLRLSTGGTTILFRVDAPQALMRALAR